MIFQSRLFQVLSPYARRPQWQFAAALSLVCLLITVSGETGRHALRYENNLLQSRQYYRALTGHFTHLGWPHLWLNLAGLLGVWAIYANSFSAQRWAVLTLLCGAGISAGLYYLNPHVAHMVGLSGTLHGLLAAALTHNLLIWIGRAKNKNKNINESLPEALPIEDVIMLLGLWAKIAYEQIIGSVPLTEAASGGPVITQTHLYGAIIGTVLGLSFTLCCPSKP